MANFRCTKCSHQVNFGLTRGTQLSDQRHSFCGGKLERIQHEKIKNHWRFDELNRPVFKSASGSFILENKLFKPIAT